MAFSYYLHMTNKYNLSQLEFAAQMAFQLNHVRKQIMDGSLPQEMLKGKTPLCSGLYKYLFNTCRIPLPDNDVVGIYDQSQFDHIIVMHDNNIYSLEINDLSVAQIRQQFELIKKDSFQISSGRKVGLLTGVNRDYWS